MPNIEIHGSSGFDAGRMIEEIRKVLADSPSAKAIVITIPNDVAVDLAGNEKPFLRVVGTDEAEARKIIDKLGSLRVDIEWLELRAFIPKA